MDPADVINPTSTRDAALARVLAYRQRVRARPLLIRATLAVVGGGLFVVSLPMIVLLPELGIPALLVAFRLLAVEAQWAVRAYAWTDWRFTQLRVVPSPGTGYPRGYPGWSVLGGRRSRLATRLRVLARRARARGITGAVMHPRPPAHDAVRYRAHRNAALPGGHRDVLPRRRCSAAQPALRTSQYRTTVASASGYAHIRMRCRSPGRPIRSCHRARCGRTLQQPRHRRRLVTLVVGKRKTEIKVRP